MDSMLTAIEKQLDPFPLYEVMRQSHPVYFDPRRHSWNVFCYDDVQRVLSDYETFSSQFRGNRRPDAQNSFAASIISTDPPRHRQLRSLATQAFTPRAVEALAPRITAIVQEHLDRVDGTGGMEVIGDLAYPLPVIVIAELLGIPSQDRERFKRWSDFAVASANDMDEVDVGRFQGTEMMEMGMYFMNMIAQRRETPGEDLISGLLEASIDGEHLSQIELLGFCVLLLVAGNETTTNLLGNAMLTFGEHPEQWEELRANPELIPQAIEEVLRYRSPVQSMFRFSRAEAVFQGKKLPANSHVIAWIGSANHDGSLFPQPETFDIMRTPNKHIAFGHGIHYCLGAPLARLEAKIALGAMLERYPAFKLAPGASLKRQPSLIVYGLHEVPIKFTP